MAWPCHNLWRWPPESTDTIWSPYGFYHNPDLSFPHHFPSYSFPQCHAPAYVKGLPKGKLWFLGACGNESSRHLDSAHGLGTTWQPGCCWFNLTLAIPSCRIRLSWDTRATKRVNSNKLGDIVAFWFLIQGPSPAFLGALHLRTPFTCCCLKGLFGSSALHTLSLAASQGWPQGPGYAINQYNQTTRPAWVESHTKLKDPHTHPSILEMSLCNFFIQD